MSSNSGPSTFRRPARSRNVSESSEASWFGYINRNNVSLSSRQCSADCGSLSGNNSPDKIKRKKRRKYLEEYNKIIKKRVIELSRSKRLDEELLRLKLKDNRIPLVLLTKLQDHCYSEPKPLKKNTKEKNTKQLKEKRIQLSGLSIPAKIDPKILKDGPIVKINKRDTDSLIEVCKRRSKKQTNIEISDVEEEKKSVGSVSVDSDLNKCTNKLTRELGNCSVNVECTKNAIASNSTRRHVRISIDKGNNDRLPEKLCEDYSKCTLNSTIKTSASDIQSESFSSNRRLKRNTIDQINSNHSTDSAENKRKCCTDSTVKSTHEKHSQNSQKDSKKYSKNAIKNIEKHSQYLTVKCNKIHAEVSNNSDEANILVSDEEIKKKQSQILPKISKKCSINLETSTRFRRNLIDKSTNGNRDSIENVDSSASYEKCSQKHCEKLNKIIQNDSESQNESCKAKQKENDKNDICINNAMNNVDSTEKFVEEHNKKSFKKIEKKSNICSNSETESIRRVTRQMDSKNEKHDKHLIDSNVNNVESFVKEHREKSFEKLDKTFEANITENVMKDKESASSKGNSVEIYAEKSAENADRNVKKVSEVQAKFTRRKTRSCHIEIAAENKINPTQQSTEKTSEKVPENLNVNNNQSSKVQTEINKKVKKLLQDETQYSNDLRENNLDLSQSFVKERKHKPCEEKLKTTKDSKTTTENKIDTSSKSSSQKYDQISINVIENEVTVKQNSTEESKQKLSKELHSIKECIKNPSENKIRRKPSSDKNENVTDNTVKNNLDSLQVYTEGCKSNNTQELIKDTKNQHENKIVTRNSLINKQEKILENAVKAKSNIILDDIKENDDFVEKGKSKIEYAKHSLENIARVSRKSSNIHQKLSEKSVRKNSDCVQNAENHEEKLADESQKVIKECSKSQIENNKRVTRKSSSDKHERNSENISIKNLDFTNTISEQNKEQLSNSKHNTSKECSQIKNVSIENKRITRKSLFDQHEKYVKLTNNDINCLQNFEKKKDEQSPNETQKVNKECVKNHKIIKKLSSNKCEKIMENNAVNNPDCIKKIDKSEINVSEESQNITRETSKIQTEIIKRITRKSSLDKQEKGSENISVSNLNSVQNFIEENNDILCKTLDNKENTKLQMEINTRITRNSSLKKENHFKNSIDNNLDCEKIVPEESKEKNLEYLANNVKVIPKNLSDQSKKCKESSVDNEINETLTENVIEENSKLSQDSVAESTENIIEVSNQSCIDSTKSVQNIQRNTKNLPEKNTEHSHTNSRVLPNTIYPQHSIFEENQKNYIDFIKGNKVSENFSEKLPDSQLENNLKSTNNSISETYLLSDNKHSIEHQSNKESSLNCTQNNRRVTRKLSENLLKCMNKDELINQQNNVNFIENENSQHIESSFQDKTCPVSVDKSNKNDSNIGIQIFSDIPTEKGEESVKNKSTEKIQNYNVNSLQTEEQDISIEENNKNSIKYSQTSLNTNENQSEYLHEKSFKIQENSIVEDKKIQSENLDNNMKLYFRIENENDKKITQHTTDKSNKNLNISIENDTKNQEISIETNFEIQTKDLDDNKISIKKSVQNCRKSTRLQLPNRNSEVLIESRNEINNITLIENPVESILVDDYENLDGSENDFSNYNNEIITNEMPENKKLEEYLDMDNMKDNTEEFLPKTASLNYNYESEELHNAVESIDYNVNDQSFDIVNNSKLENGNLAKQRREITLMELKKKCTENLGKKYSAKLEHFNKETYIKNVLPSPPTDTTEPSSDSCTENTMEAEETYFDNCSDGIDSDENLADKLAHFNKLKTSSMKSLETSYSGKETSVNKSQQLDKLVLKCPKMSFLESNTNYNCKHCSEHFYSNRELKRHVKDQHRQRLVLKISKTDMNEHVSHIIEPVSTTNVESVEKNEVNNKTNSEITEGEIKIIVKKESGSKNSHVVKEIKITPKSSDGSNSCRIPDSPAKSDISSGNNYVTNSPASLELPLVKKRVGRPRKYPIFTEAELIAKQLATKEDYDDSCLNKINDGSSQSAESVMQSKHDTKTSSTYNVSSDSSLEKGKPKSKVGRKRKRPNNLSADDNLEKNANLSETNKSDNHSEKKQKLFEDTIEEEISFTSTSVSDSDFQMKYKMTKELVVRLTKIDSVPKVSEEFNTDIEQSGDTITNNSNEEMLKKKVNSKVACEEEENSHHESIKTVIKLNLKKKLENNNNNNNNVNDAEKSVTESSSPKRVQKTVDTSNLDICESSAYTDTTPVIEENQDFQGTKKQLDNKSPEEAIKSQLVVTPRRQTIDKTEADESQKAKLLMLMNATTPYETTNVVTTSTTLTEFPQPEVLQPQSQTQAQPQPQLQLQPQPQPQPQPHLQLQHQLQSQFQLQSSQPQSQSLQVPLPQPQQFCILFIPDTLYSADGNISKDATPTATIVNFQPVPDSEIANKSLIYTPTTPTKISTDEHSKSYVCANCTEVLDLIGRLEASLGMTEEDKSAIKCPYCSNHFQSLFYLEYHVMQEHLKCENEKQCRHSGFNSLRIPCQETSSEFETYITFALKCRSCYDIFSSVLLLNDHVMHKHKTLVRLKPMLSSSPTSSSSSALCSTFPPFVGKNGSRGTVLQCPSDCVCRIGIRSTDTPLQRQQMLKRCPNAMRRLEKIEPAAYEVYTCTLCKSTFLMKDEVVDHLMKMHEVSCKFPCYTCLTSFRTLQLQENHHCSETTLHDLDKLLSIAILPANVSGKEDNNKFLEREDSSTDEYGAIKADSTPIPKSPPPHRNGFKRKNGTTISALNQIFGISAAKKAKLGNNPGQQITNNYKRRKKTCPKCKKRFAYRKSFHDHIIYEHILTGKGNNRPKKIAAEILKLMSVRAISGQKVEELAALLNGCTDEDGMSLKNLIMIDENQQENWKEKSESNKEILNEKNLAQCAKCKACFKLPANSGNLTNVNNHHLPSDESSNLQLCESCKSSGPKTRRRAVINNGHNDLKTTSDSATSETSSQPDVIYPFACKKCSETFPTSIELKSHKRSVHTKLIEKKHSCDLCKKTFYSSRMLEKHKKIHRESVLGESAKPEEDDNNKSMQNIGECSKDGEANDSLNDKANSSNRRDSSDSSSGGSKEPEEQPLNCSFCEEVCSSKVSLKNHLKREHGRRASICQFCNGLLIDTSEVRHMLDYHIVPSKLSSRQTMAKSNDSIVQYNESSMQEDVEELIRILGKHRLQSLMVYYDFEGKCNNAVMRCPICPELFATRESCRFHYVWIHDDTCLLCDEVFRSGSSACQHKVDTHTSTASYLWCIQRLVTAIVNTLRLDPDQPSHVLYQILAMRLQDEEENRIQIESIIARCNTEKGNSEEASNATERFLEEVVLSEDQLPDSGNIIEVVIGKEDSEDDLLSMLNLSPNYESCEQHKIPNAGAAPPEEEEDDETVLMTSAPITPPTNAMTSPVTITSPVVENYVTSGVCKYRLDNDEEQLVLVVTDDDLITYKDDIGSLAERISATCDSLTLEEITEMLRAYFENVNISNDEAA